MNPTQPRRFFPSPYEKAVSGMDGVGEGHDSAWLGQGNTLSPLWEIPFPHSMDCSIRPSLTTGFKVIPVNKRGWDLLRMGSQQCEGDFEHLLDREARRDVSFEYDYFNYCTALP